MPSAEDERMMWLTEAQRVIDNWDNERPGSARLTFVDTGALAARMASALQRAYDQGRASRSQ